MKIRKMFLGLVVIGFVGVLMVGTVQALDFEDWSQVWFKLQVKQNVNGTNGKISDAIPPGSPTVSKYKDQFSVYLVVDNCTAESPAACEFTLCTFDGTYWVPQPSGTWPLLAGNPEKFLTLFDFTYTENPLTPITQRFLTPLQVKATVKDSNPHAITGASIENLGGAFLVTVGVDPVEQYAIGAAQITSSWVQPQNVLEKVPAGCRIPLGF
jgi:hypothetical protein